MKILIGALVLLSVQHMKCQFEIELPDNIDESVGEILQDLPPASLEQLQCFVRKALDLFPRSVFHCPTVDLQNLVSLCKHDCFHC